MSETQSEAQNIQQEINMKTRILYGKMRRGKTLTGIRIALDFKKRIYGNVNIYKEIKGEKKLICKRLQTFKEFNAIRFSYEPGVILIDEVAINANSKDSASNTNRILHEMLRLAGKKNCSLVFISQRYKSIDINFREMADHILEIKKFYVNNRPHPVFKIIKQRQSGERLKFICAYNNDTISEFKREGISYNTLEVSRITEEKKPKK